MRVITLQKSRDFYNRWRSEWLFALIACWFRGKGKGIEGLDNGGSELNEALNRPQLQSHLHFFRSPLEKLSAKTWFHNGFCAFDDVLCQLFIIQLSSKKKECHGEREAFLTFFKRTGSFEIILDWIAFNHDIRDIYRLS
ncbi:uncharacterized protein MONOS_17951 [Monocercomonoides exilis]|uniref:uncharacterized protein n=1 Tax=Monocercomonoides exilis TaxID=2049356 RepID=UPI00355A3743|nr:hypothetical protein MONOS_17951 [Monocercomonoides exilis]